MHQVTKFLLNFTRLYNNCSFHGRCESRKVGKNKDCWVCNCNSRVFTDDNGQSIPGFEAPVKWTGPQCQFQDISVPFQIIFWTSVALILVLFMVIGMMANTESGDSFTGNQFEHRLKED